MNILLGSHRCGHSQRQQPWKNVHRHYQRHFARREGCHSGANCAKSRPLDPIPMPTAVFLDHGATCTQTGCSEQPIEYIGAVDSRLTHTKSPFFSVFFSISYYLLLLLQAFCACVTSSMWLCILNQNYINIYIYIQFFFNFEQIVVDLPVSVDACVCLIILSVMQAIQRLVNKFNRTNCFVLSLYRIVVIELSINIYYNLAKK